MASAPYQRAGYRQGTSARGRATSLGLSLGLVAFLILLLLRLGVLPAPLVVPMSRPNTFRLAPDGERAAMRPHPAAARRAGGKAAPKAAPRPAVVPPPPPVPRPMPAFPALRLDHDTLASADIGAMAHTPGKSGEGDADSGTDSAAIAGPGEGPGGAKLFYAEWYREPPPGALALYLPDGPQPGWAMVACRTIADYHVDNCRELGESPRGAGTARALRQAAWQFLVRPPRLGGKPLLGTWVRIRFDFSERGAEVAR